MDRNLSSSKLIAFEINVCEWLNMPRNMASARTLIRDFATDQEAFSLRLVEAEIPQDLFQEYMSIINGSEKTVQSITSTALAALEIFADPNVQACTNTTTIDLESFRSRSQVLYFSIPIMQMESFGVLNSMFFTALLDAFMSRPVTDQDNTISIICDEASSFYNMKQSILPLATSQLRKFKAFLQIGYQSFSQCKNLLGVENATTLLSNCGSLFFLPPQDLETCIHLSKRMGNITIEKDGKKHVRPLMTPDEIAYSRHDAILFCGTHRAMLLNNLIPYYRKMKYKRWSELPVLILPSILDSIEIKNNTDSESQDEFEEDSPSHKEDQESLPEFEAPIFNDNNLNT